jgi:molecular chaperone Hsp33
VSTQVPSAVAVGVRLGPGGSVLGAAGILAQRLPDGDERSVERLEAALTALGPVSAAAASGLGALDLLERLLGNLGHGEVRALPVRWRCGCNRERTARLVAALGRKTLDAMIVEDGGAELVCQFCGAVYRFDADELGELRDQALDQPPPGRGDANGPPRRP